MAVAGLHNVSVLDSSFLRESQSPVSRLWGNQDWPSTRAPSLLQMWRDLEGEHAASHPQVRFVARPRQHRSDVSTAEFATTYLSEGRRGDNGDSLEDANDVEDEYRTFPQGQMGSHNEHEEDNISCSSEQSSDFGEVERERVRQIFQEWMNIGLMGHESNVSRTNNCSKAQWLGENERERVRIVREWVEMITQQRGTCRGSREEQSAEIGSQIELVRDGLVVNHCEIGGRRAIRRLCGRQALLDLLVRADRERKRELQSLLEHRPVSDFAHRSRIQSLLRGRFLRNESFIQDQRPTSLDASELGLLRQRHTVSGLREGFLSRLDKFICGQPGSAQSDLSSNDGMNDHRNEQTQANRLQDVLEEICDQSESYNGERDISLFHTDDLESDTDRGIDQQESTAHVEERREQVENEEREQFIVRGDDNGEDMVGNWQGSNGNELSQDTVGIEGSGQGTPLDPRTNEIVHGVSGLIDHLEGNTVEDFNWQDMSAQVAEWQESDWQQLAGVEFSEHRDGAGEDMDVNSQESSQEWYQGTPGNDDSEQSHLQEYHEGWHENDLQEATGNWLDGPSSQVVAPVGRIDAFYFTDDDDNGYSLELRELLSRRRVSNLLQSGFRESLDQLIQSYVERQGHASVEWELEGTSQSPAFVEQGQEQQNGDQNGPDSDTVERIPLFLPSPPVSPPQTLLEQDLHDDANWQSTNIHQHLGIDWEIINELRIDMARLQQRMNNMQMMLEACMDMQLELQRSVRQEVSAALNRSFGSSEACENSLPKDESKWDHVRKGICCICCDSNIDSLLYRCGHMCTCSKCADNLVQGRGKCPMCRAPAVEVIRAYSIQ